MARSKVIIIKMLVCKSFFFYFFSIFLPDELSEEAGAALACSTAGASASLGASVAAGATEGIASSKVKSLKAATSDSSSTKIAIG